MLPLIPSEALSYERTTGGDLVISFNLTLTSTLSHHDQLIGYGYEAAVETLQNRFYDYCVGHLLDAYEITEQDFKRLVLMDRVDTLSKTFPKE